MPIEIINLPTAQRSHTSTNEGTAAGRTQTGNQSNHTENETDKAPYADTVTLTETATQLQIIASEITDIPIVNIPRVEEMRNRIENGEFEIDSDKVASNMLRLETQL